MLQRMNHFRLKTYDNEKMLLKWLLVRSIFSTLNFHLSSMVLEMLILLSYCFCQVLESVVFW